MKGNFLTTVGRAFKTVGFKINKHSPEIMVVVGVVGVVTSAVMACKATTKAGKVIDECKENIKTVNDAVEGKIETTEPYTEEDGKKDTQIYYAKTGLQIVKLYAPSVILGALSLTSIVASHTVLSKRMTALSAAYTTLDQSFKNYKDKVAEKIGKEAEKNLKLGIKPTEVEEQVVNKETGEVTTEKKIYDLVDDNPANYSPYAVFFDESNDNWLRNADDNKYFLVSAQNMFNDRLKRDGRVFLNDVLKELGFKPTKQGQIVGWVYDPDNPNHSGDNFIDFGIYDVRRKAVRNFVNGYERSIILDFNVDGNVWEKMA